MKLKPGLIFSSLNGETVVVAAGAAGEHFKGMMKMNETAAYLAGMLQTEQTEEELVLALLSQYEVDRETAVRNVRYVVKQLTTLGLMD